jgi:phosphoglycolate/pyridoxal phosphate phosphatase family enzyme
MKNTKLKPEFTDFKLFIVDLDGTIYRGEKLIPGADVVINTLHKLNKEVIFLTNNASKLRKSFHEKLSNMNIVCQPERIVSSGLIATKLLFEKYSIRTIYIIGSDDLIQMSENAGLNVINTSIDETILNAPFLDKSIKCDAILCGWDINFTYSKIRTAMELVARGARFFATNSDKTYPHSNQYWPGTGVIVAALEACIGRPPEIIFGKPHTFGIDFIFNMINKGKPIYNRQNTVIVGDRLETDIIQANLTGIKSILVETGINTRSDIPQSKSKKDQNLVPTYVIPSIRDIFV